MSQLFIKLLNMSITAGWLVLAVILLRLLLRKAPKWIRLLLWAMVALRLICPFSLESVTSLIPSAETVQVVKDTGWDQFPLITVHSGFEQVDAVINPALVPSYPTNWSTQSTPAETIDLVSYIWLAGVGAMLLYALISYLLLRRRVRASLRKDAGIYSCDDIASPFILGIVKPRIYLPSGLGEQTAVYVLAHEQAHIRRLDQLWKPLGFLLLSVYWFNPLIWVGYILFCRDIELACDERVIRSLDDQRRADYSQALLDCSISGKAVAPCPLAFGETDVKERIKKVLHYKKPALWIIIAAVVICIVAAVLLLTDPKPTPFATEQPPIYETDSLYISNGFYIAETPPFSLPDFQIVPEESEGNYIYYTKVTPQKMDAYCDLLVSEGFEMQKFMFSRFFYRSGCAINIVYSTELETQTASLHYYVQRPDQPSAALSAQEALELIKQGPHLTIYGQWMPSHDLYAPIDITPEGLFERSGYQIFIQPIHSYELLPDQLDNEHNARYSTEYFLVNREGAYFFIGSYSCIAVTDMDGNGIDELWMHNFGSTSGLYSISIIAWENGEIKYSNAFLTEPLYLSFSEKDGKLCLRGVSQLNEGYTYDFDISIVDGKIVLTGPDNEPVEYVRFE